MSSRPGFPCGELTPGGSAVLGSGVAEARAGGVVGVSSRMFSQCRGAGCGAWAARIFVEHLLFARGLVAMGARWRVRGIMLAMQTFIAHYISPKAAAQRAKGLFEFQSDARMGSKANLHDARLRMLELYGKDAVAWTIERVERKKAAAPAPDGQLELDFRAPAPQRKRAKKKEWW